MSNSRPILAWIHLLAGITGLLAFLATGLFMDRSLNHLVGMADAPRALYRSAHIYLLFAALVNMGLGAYLTLRHSRWVRGVQYLGSALLLPPIGMFLYGFIVETPLAQIERPVIREGIYLCLAGILVHVVASFGNRGGESMPIAVAANRARALSDERVESTA